MGEGNDGVVVVSERLWRRRFNSDPQLVGQQLPINGRSFTVVGIMPAQFEFPLPLFGVQGATFAERADIWKPVAFTPDELKIARSRAATAVIGRLKPGVTLKQAQAELDTVDRGLVPALSRTTTKRRRSSARTLYAIQDLVVGPMRGALWILLGAVAVVLLIACANLTTMLLARAGAREREFAIRLALGAGRAQLVRQMLSESLLLAVVGGPLGVMLAIWGLDLLRSIGAQTVPRIAEVNLDLRVLFVTLDRRRRHRHHLRSHPRARDRQAGADGSAQGRRPWLDQRHSSQSPPQRARHHRSGARARPARRREPVAEELRPAPERRSRIQSEERADDGSRACRS